MTNRSANASIKGYFYQFDHTIVQILSSNSPKASILVEGMEDIDLADDNDKVLIQCKYYEGTDYQHSVIKPAIIQMLRHFHKNGCQATQTLRYRLYGHYRGGQERLPGCFDLNFLKKNFLTYAEVVKHAAPSSLEGKDLSAVKDPKQAKVVHEVHMELGITDSQLANFKKVLEIDVLAMSYDEQQRRVEELLKSQISGCSKDDAQLFYYPNAINTIQNLAIQASVEKRTITKAEFLESVNCKEIVFSLWLRQKFGDDYYAKSIKKKYFQFPSTKVPKAARIFIIDLTDDFDLAKTTALLSKIGTRFSHKEHARTPAQDQFCPYIFLRGVMPEQLISLKGNLLVQGVKIVDGYLFNGATFSPTALVMQPTKENLIKLKFISTAPQIQATVSSISGSLVELFEFYKGTVLEEKYLPPNVVHHKIKIDNIQFIKEVI